MTDAVIGLIGTIIGGAIGVIGTYIGAVKVAKKQILIDAGRKLREAFSDELAALEADGRIDAHLILSNAFQKHRAAVVEFRYILPEHRHHAFDLAWQQYHCIEEPPYPHFLEKYMTIGVSAEEGNENRKLAIERIHNIFSFTK